MISSRSWVMTAKSPYPLTALKGAMDPYAAAKGAGIGMIGRRNEANNGTRLSRKMETATAARNFFGRNRTGLGSPSAANLSLAGLPQTRSSTANRHKKIVKRLKKP